MTTVPPRGGVRGESAIGSLGDVLAKAQERAARDRKLRAWVLHLYRWEIRGRRLAGMHTRDLELKAARLAAFVERDRLRRQRWRRWSVPATVAAPVATVHVARADPWQCGVCPTLTVDQLQRTASAGGPGCSHRRCPVSYWLNDQAGM